MIHAFRLVGLWTQVMARVRVLETLQALTSSLFKRPEFNVSWFCIGLGIGAKGFRAGAVDDVYGFAYCKQYPYTKISAKCYSIFSCGSLAAAEEPTLRSRIEPRISEAPSIRRTLHRYALRNFGMQALEGGFLMRRTPQRRFRSKNTDKVYLYGNKKLLLTVHNGNMPDVLNREVDTRLKNTYIYIYTCVYVCMYMHLCVYIHKHVCTDSLYTCTLTCMHAYIHTYMHTYTHTYSHTYVHTHKYIHLHPYKHMYIYMHIYMYILIHIYIHIHANMHIRTHTNTYIHLHPYEHMYIYMHIYVYIYIHIYIRIHFHMHMHMHIHTHIYKHVHIYIKTTCIQSTARQTYKHTDNAHTYIYIHTHTHAPNLQTYRHTLQFSYNQPHFSTTNFLHAPLRTCDFPLKCI